MARVVPTFILTLTNGASFIDVSEDKNVREIVMKEVIEAVKEGIKAKKNNISLFKINDSGYVVGLDKEQWKPSLESALNHYEELEQYNKCSEIKKMIDLL
jgi:hypothetical protein